MTEMAWIEPGEAISTFVLTRNLSQNTYSYNAGGIRTANAVSVFNQPNRVEQYEYDALNRLTSVNYGDEVTQGYSFDNMGNRVTKTEGGTTETYGYNAANMLVSRNGQAYVSDANGNTLSGGGRTNTWDSQNRLVKCVSGSNTSVFTYGSDGLRRTSVVNGTPTHYALDNGMLVREFSATLQPTATYLPGPRGVEYRRNDATGQTMWYLYDGLGSVLAEIDALGNMTTPRKYDVYGLVRAGDAGSSKHKFVGSLGHTSEDETGLIYMRARWMDPTLGRFISEDPARDGANWFEYCRGNPVNAVDPDGCETLASTMASIGGMRNVLWGSFYAGIVGAVMAAVTELMTTGSVSARTVLVGFAGGVALNLAGVGAGLAFGRLGIEAAKDICLQVACTVSPRSLGEFALHIVGATTAGTGAGFLVGALLIAGGARAEMALAALE